MRVPIVIRDRLSVLFTRDKHLIKADDRDDVDRAASFLQGKAWEWVRAVERGEEQEFWDNIDRMARAGITDDGGADAVIGGIRVNFKCVIEGHKYCGIPEWDVKKKRADRYEVGMLKLPQWDIVPVGWCTPNDTHTIPIRPYWGIELRELST